MTGIKFILSTSAYSLFIFALICGVCVLVAMCHRVQHVEVGDNLQVSVLSFHRVGSKHRTQVAKFSVLAASAPSLRACSWLHAAINWTRYFL